jgi:hypothetical protein
MRIGREINLMWGEKRILLQQLTILFIRPSMNVDLTKYIDEGEEK